MPQVLVRTLAGILAASRSTGVARRADFRHARNRRPRPDRGTPRPRHAAAIRLHPPLAGPRSRHLGNRCTMRRGTEFDDLRWKRDMQRATVCDVANSCEQAGIKVRRRNGLRLHEALELGAEPVDHASQSPSEVCRNKRAVGYRGWSRHRASSANRAQTAAASRPAGPSRRRDARPRCPPRSPDRTARSPPPCRRSCRARRRHWSRDFRRQRNGILAANVALNADEPRWNGEQRLRARERDRAVAVIEMAWIAGPGERDPRPFQRADPRRPFGQMLVVGRQDKEYPPALCRARS